MEYNHRVYTYDIWGNEKDGYDVNDVFRTADTITFEDTLSDKELIEKIKVGLPYLLYDVEEVRIDGENEFSLYFYDDANDKPLFELRNQG